MTLNSRLDDLPEESPEVRPLAERLGGALRRMRLALGAQGIAWAAAAGLVAVICGAVSIAQVARSLGAAEVEHGRNKAAEIHAFDQKNRALLRSLFAQSTGQGRLPEADLPVDQAWVRAQAARAAICDHLDDRASNVATLRTMCAAGAALADRLGPEITAFDPPRRLIEPATMHDAAALSVRLNELSAQTAREADLLIGRMAEEYREALLVLMLSTGGFAAACLVLIGLVGRASILHYEQSQKAGEVRDLLQETIEAVPAGIAVYDRDERLMMFNAAAAEATPTLRKPGVIGMTYEALAHETARENADAGRPLEGSPQEWVERFRSRSSNRSRQWIGGRWFDWSERATPSGHTVGLRVDITEIRQRELEAERARAEYQSLVDSMSDMVYALDIRGVFTFVSAAAADLVGVPPQRMVGTRFRDYLLPEDVAPVLASGRAFHASSDRMVHHAQMRLRAADGTIRHVEVRYRKPAGNADGQAAQVGVMRDVSERVEMTKRLERQVVEIEQARADYQALVNALSDIVFKIDTRSGTLTFVSDASTALLGATPQELLGTGALDHIADEDRARVRAAIVAEFKSGDGGIRQLQYLARMADGTGKYVEVRFRRLSTADGSPVIAGVLRDVDERVQLARRLDMEVARLRSIIESSGAQIVLVDRDLKMVMANSGFTAMTGLGEAAAVGRPLKEIVDYPIDAGVLEGWLAEPPDRARMAAVHFANQIRDRAGRQRLISVTATPVLDDGGRMNSIVFLGVDDTERREAERALFDAERLAAVGEIAATVAHEITQPLQVINIACAAAEQEMTDAADANAAPEAEFLRSKLDLIARQVERAGRIVGDLRAFVRGAAADEAAPFDPAVAVHAAVDLTQYALRQAGVDLSVSIAESLPSVAGHVGRLEQVLVNLIINARDAGGRTVGIAARPLDRDGRVFVRIVVEDSGVGIPDDILPRLFVAFVTSKPRGQGTGLGLRICRRIVEDMGGTITAANRPEGGARFELVLPAAGEV